MNMAVFVHMFTNLSMHSRRCNAKSQKWFISFFCLHKVWKMEKKIRLLGVWKKSNPFIGTFLLKYESAYILLTFCKNFMSGENLILKLCSKRLSRPIRIQDSLNSLDSLQYLTNELRYKVNFLYVIGKCLGVLKVMPKSELPSSQ